MTPRLLRNAALAVFLACSAAGAQAQSFPAKTVRLIVGFSPGGNVDIPARIVAAKLGEMWNASVVVENRVGAGGSIAAAMVAQALADGYTLLLCNAASNAIDVAFYKNLPYDPVKDFAPISQVGWVPNILIVNPATKFHTVGEFVAYAKANPGKVSYASAGVGTSQHLAMELLKSMTDIDVVHVPYKGGHPALTDVLGGQIQVMLGAVPTTQAAVKSGKVRALGVTSAKRSAQLPDVPTIAESGVPGYEVTSWYGLCGPAALPKALMTKLNADLVKALNSPDTQQRLAEQGIEVLPSTPEQFGAYIKSEVSKWVKVVKAAGISAE